MRITKDKRRKPYVHVIYDHTKGGVDIANLISTHNSARMQQKRWLLNTPALLLNITLTNTKTILYELQSHVKLPSFEFTFRLGKMLVLLNIDRRYSNSNGLRIGLVQRTCKVLGTVEVNYRPTLNLDSTQGGLHVCVKNIVGTLNYKNDPKKMNHQLKSRCAKCQGFVCKNHAAVLFQS